MSQNANIQSILNLFLSMVIDILRLFLNEDSQPIFKKF